MPDPRPDDDIGDDEIDIVLRSTEEVGRRMIALSAVAHRVGAEPADEPDDEDDDPDGLTDEVEERLDWLAWLTDHALIDALTAREQAILRSEVAQFAEDDEEQSAAAESLGALAWSVGQSKLTVLDRGYPYVSLLGGVPAPWVEPRPFLDALTLRDESDIAVARDAAEVLSWRAQVEIERRSADAGQRSEIEAAIRDVAAEAGANGVATVGRDGDLLVGGESIHDMSDAVAAGMVAAARARLRAMNWLCGLGDWDDPILTDI